MTTPKINELPYFPFRTSSRYTPYTHTDTTHTHLYTHTHTLLTLHIFIARQRIKVPNEQNGEDITELRGNILPCKYFDNQGTDRVML